MAQTAKQKGDTLETTVHSLELAILRSFPAYSEKTFRIQPKRIITVEGVRHEIDICVTVELGHGYDSVFIFECKNWEKKVTKNDIIVFSEKINVTKAQKGFFVAKSFTKDAIAQAKRSGRVETLLAREVGTDGVLEWVKGMSRIERRAIRLGIKLKFLGEVEGNCSDNPWDMDYSSNGQTVDIVAYTDKWMEDLGDRMIEKIRSGNQDQGTYTGSFEELRVFQDNSFLANGRPLEHIGLEGAIEFKLLRAEILSSFEIGGRGRVHHSVIRAPEGDTILTTRFVNKG